MQSAFRKIAGSLKEFGYISGLLYLVDQAFSRANSRFRISNYELMAQPVSKARIAPENLTRSVTIRELEEGDPLLERIFRPAEVISNRFKQSSVCLGAFQNDAFIGYQWLCFGPYEEDEVRCLFVPQPVTSSVFDYDFYLFPRHRLGIGFVALWDGANEYLRNRKIRYTTSRVSRYNVESRKSHLHLGWKRIGTAIFLSGKRYQLMVASVAPYVHLSFSPNSRPQVNLNVEDNLF